MNHYIAVGIVLIVIVALMATNKKLVETLKNIYKIEELRKRILYTLGLLLVYRLGSFVVIPGINPNALGEGSALANQMSDNSLLGLLDVFSGGAFGNAAIFALGVMPYITASIIIQLMGIMIPYFQKMQKEGESGRRKMDQWTRFLTIVVLAIQGPAYVANLFHTLPATAFIYGHSFWFVVYATVILIAGTMFIMWLGEKITDKGIGNGISLIIMIGIVARLPHALLAEVNARFQTSDGSAIMIILELVLLALVFMATIALVQAVRKVPVQYAKRIIGNKQYGGVRQYIPLKMNAANVMPIIFAQALMFIPMLFTKIAPGFAGAFAGDRLHLFLYGDHRQSSNDGGRHEAQRRLYPGCQTGQADGELHRHHHDADHPSGFVLPGHRGDSARAGDEVPQRAAGLRLFLRRYVAADHGRRDPRHSQADREPPLDASLRRPDEDRTHPGAPLIVCS